MSKRVLAFLMVLLATVAVFAAVASAGPEMAIRATSEQFVVGKAGYAPLMVCFQADYSETQPRFTIWDFGDNTAYKLVAQNCCHTYLSRGLYEITATGYFADGHEQTESVKVTVFPPRGNLITMLVDTVVSLLGLLSFLTG